MKSLVGFLLTVVAFNAGAVRYSDDTLTIGDNLGSNDKVIELGSNRKIKSNETSGEIELDNGGGFSPVVTQGVLSAGLPGPLIVDGAFTANDTATFNTTVFTINGPMTVTGLTTLDVALAGPLRATAGVVSAGNISLTSEVSGILPIASGGTNSSTALANDFVMVSSGGAIVESAVSTTTLGNFLVSPMTTDGDLIYYNSGETRLGKGTDGQVLQMLAGFPAWVDFAGSGSGSKLNFLEHGSFESGELGELVGVNAAITEETSVVLVTPNNESSAKIVSSGVATVTSDVTTSAEWHEGMQLETKCWIKTGDSGITFSSIRNGVVASTLNVINDNKWHPYTIPLTAGSSSSGYRVDVDATSKIAYLDECSTQPKDFSLSSLSSSHFVGSLMYKETNCLWAGTNGTYGPYATDSDCTASELEGGGIAAPLTNIPGFRIPNPRTDGQYFVSLMTAFRGSTNSETCHYTLSSTSVYDNQGQTRVESGSPIKNTLLGSFRFSDNSEKTIQTLYKKNSGTANCDMRGGPSTANPTKFTVHFMPDKAANVVAQTCLNGDCVNTLGVRVDGVGGCVVTSDSASIVDSCTRNSAGDYDIGLKAGAFSVVPASTCSSESGTARLCVINGTPTTTNIPIKTTNSSNTATDQRFSISITKQDADFITTKNIVGSFSGHLISDVGGVIGSEACRINNSGTPAKDSGSGLCNWITTITDDAVGITTLSWTSDIFSSEVVCTGNLRGAGWGFISLTESTGEVEVRTRNSADALSDIDFFIRCTGKR